MSGWNEKGSLSWRKVVERLRREGRDGGEEYVLYMKIASRASTVLSASLS
jgi:hypothetical protein